MPNFWKFKLRKKKAFTLVEVLVAVFILIVGAGTAFSLVSQMFSTASLIRDRFIAAYLAQEGIEIVKNIRDSNWIAGQSWNQGLSPGSYQADYNDFTLSSFNGNPLRIESSGFYGYGLGSPTKFVRQITLRNLDPNKIEVRVTVSWRERGREHNFILKSIITNWLNP